MIIKNRGRIQNSRPNVISSTLYIREICQDIKLMYYAHNTNLIKGKMPQ